MTSIYTHIISNIFLMRQNTDFRNLKLTTICIVLIFHDYHLYASQYYIAYLAESINKTISNFKMGLRRIRQCISIRVHYCYG